MNQNMNAGTTTTAPHRPRALDRAAALLPWLFVAVLALVFFLIHLRVPLFADDYCLKLRDPTLGNVLSGVWNNYLHWSGRFPALSLDLAVFSTGRIGIQALALMAAGAFCTLAALSLSVSDRPSTVSSRLAVIACFGYLSSPA